ncbi:MAG TPA: carbamoyltransferase HypF [Ktedonobacterales bacterium]|nr:carbamoyltransferase HypF [Ktedonobacterales bacterium]
MPGLTSMATERRRILAQGIIQGVGFRPFVYGLAQRWGLTGFVLNDSAGVTIEVEGAPEAVDGFVRALREETPPLARIDTLVVEPVAPRQEKAFKIVQSQAGAERQALISPDMALCDDCLRELFDPGDRRYRYPFINCTNCGPRFTIIQDVPYDREKTTMRGFPLCAACQAEYDDPLNRRFHAQPNACPVCGPQLALLDMDEQPVECADPILEAAQRLMAGAILAIKGIGGYHLACNALDAEAVQRLRQRKQREAKPFALMVPSLEAARRLCFLSEAEAALLTSRRRPIVLLQQRPGNPIALAVAPAYTTLGLMLPYAPLHYLLLDACAGVCEDRCLVALVMTSGNLSDEPIVYQDQEASERLAFIADGLLTHNREIYTRCDDSITRIAAGAEQLSRRSRGYVPEPLSLSVEAPVPLLACGGHLKNTFCLVKGTKAFLSHHIGDLENLEALTSFREGINHFKRLFDIEPQAVAYDLHPEYLATKYALESAIPRRIGVQHHHAHIASVLAEHELTKPVIGVAADGTGYGTDEAIWGCEIFSADLEDFQRLAHLAYAPLPGGDQAVRQTWRMAAVYLAEAYGEGFLNLDIPFVRQLDQSKWHTLAQMIERKLNSPATSRLGRLFDAVAALVGIRSQALYEGQAAIELEMQATIESGCYPFAIEDGAPAKLDVRPLIRALVTDVRVKTPAATIAGRFHTSIAMMLAEACRRAREQTGLNIVALSGGVFQNRLLLERLLALLEEMRFQVAINRLVPPNDGGLCLGQAAVAAARLRAFQKQE